jgi:hypothetical protein
MAVWSIGLTPISPPMEVVPVVEIPDFAKIVKLPAVPRSTGAGPAAVVVPVVKLHVLMAANALPARSLIPVVIVAVYEVLAARLLAGSKVATLPEEVKVAKTAVVPCFNVKLAWVIVEGSIASLKVAVMFLLTTTPVAVSAGSVELTVGGVVSPVVPVVKLHVLLTAIVLPARSLTPVVIVAVYCVLAVRAGTGLKIALVLTQVTVPEIDIVPCIKVNVVVLQLEGAIGSLKVAVILQLRGTPMAALKGMVELTVGLVVSAGAPAPLSLELEHPAMPARNNAIKNIL